MTWFAVHALIAIRHAEDVGPISVYENVLLLEAGDGAQARTLARELCEAEAEAEAEVAVDDSLTIDGIDSVRRFVGVRKVVAVSNPHPLDLDEDRPVSGTEITYSEYEVDSEDALQQLVAGKAIDVRYVD